MTNLFLFLGICLPMFTFAKMLFVVRTCVTWCVLPKVCYSERTLGCRTVSLPKKQSTKTGGIVN